MGAELAAIRAHGLGLSHSKSNAVLKSSLKAPPAPCIRQEFPFAWGKKKKNTKESHFQLFCFRKEQGARALEAQKAEAGRDAQWVTCWLFFFFKGCWVLSYPGDFWRGCGTRFLTELLAKTAAAWCAHLQHGKGFGWA